MKDYIAGEARWQCPSQGADLPPTGAKCLILTTGGVCVVGAWGQGCVAWAPLPRMHDEVRNALDSAGSYAMNERIQKFMESCFDITVDHRGREECNTDYRGIEKFADLIIRECAELSTGYTGNVKLLICNHFGIEP